MLPWVLLLAPSLGIKTGSGWVWSSGYILATPALDQWGDHRTRMVPRAGLRVALILQKAMRSAEVKYMLKVTPAVRTQMK